MRSGIAAEADAILFAERTLGEEAMIEKLSTLLERSFTGERQKRRVLVIKAEGVQVPTATMVKRLQAFADERLPGVGVRETILGHVVRGGSPSQVDRVIAQRLALAATLGAEKGLHDVMFAWEAPPQVGMSVPDPAIRAIPIAEVLTETQRMIDGTSDIVRRRVRMLEEVEGVLAL
jgi:6-phosphofructokinase 1